MRVRLTPPAEVAAKHRAAQERTRPRVQTTAPGPRPLRNLRPVLELGNTTYFTFRGRAYGVPPVPHAKGEELMSLWVQALQYPGPLTAVTHPPYFAIVRQLPALLWQLCRPTGRVRRLLRWLRLWRNPFERATEGELVELASFFLQRRMTSSIGYGRPNQVPQGPPAAQAI